MSAGPVGGVMTLRPFDTYLARGEYLAEHLCAVCGGDWWRCDCDEEGDE